MYNYHKAYTINLRVKISATDYLTMKCKDRTKFNAVVTIMSTSNLLHNYNTSGQNECMCMERSIES